jgi:Icc protein
MKRMAFITDIHLDEESVEEIGVDAHKNWNWILEDVRARNINEIIFGGDIGALKSNEYFFKSLALFKLRCILGNHDRFEEVIHHFKPHPAFDRVELYYAEETAFIKFIFLDSSSAEISSTQLNWLKQELLTLKK